MADQEYTTGEGCIHPPLHAPFPYFGGKTLAAPLLWELFGDVPNYVEPFAGSLATLLLRPHTPKLETVNDKDALIANAWRAMATDPQAVATWCDRPPNEADQHAIHTWLVGQRETFTARLMGDPDYYDAQVAGRWLYGICCWIGSGWCSGKGPWQSIEDEEGHRQFVDTRVTGEGQEGAGCKRQRVHLGNAGEGVHRQRVHLGNAGEGVHRQRVHLGGAGGEQRGLLAWFEALQARLRYVRVCCGDWERVMGPSVTVTHGLTGILLDPPYSLAEDRDARIYAVDDVQIAHAVRNWCLTHGVHPLLRIVLCGYGDAHDALLTQGWRRYTWKAQGGLGNLGDGRGRQNKVRETLWASPACLAPQSTAQLDLFGK